jgi:ubiquinone/menaquinone biosynthesis C-methylase UbiE
MNELKYTKVKNEFELIRKYIQPGKPVLDIGCGQGNLVKAMIDAGYKAFGIDKDTLIEEAINKPGSRDLRKSLFTGKAEKIPFEDGTFDFLVLFASFHHIPQDKMKKAFTECKRVLTPKGRLLIVEPDPQKGDYYELLKLANDEKEIQYKAYKSIQKLAKQFFGKNAEKYYYMPRTIDDYKNVLNIYVKGLDKKYNIFSKAEAIIYKEKFPDLFKSTVRVNLLSN